MASPTAVVKPMLAVPTPAGQTSQQLIESLGAEWIFEPKLDGFRCLMHVVDGRAILRSRTGKDITQRFSATALPELDGPYIIDGELIAVDESGRPSFNLVQRATGKPGDPVASYVAFDLLYDCDELDIRQQPWVRRRELLEQLQPSGLIVVPYSNSGQTIWDIAASQGLEGAIAKRTNSPYRAGRSREWVKLKRVQTLSAIVTGFNEGAGSRAGSFGSLAMGLLKGDGEIVAVGDVGSGFNEKDLATLKRRELPFVVEVQYQEWTGSALRAPVFKGIRDDIPLTDCSFALQLPGVHEP